MTGEWIGSLDGSVNAQIRSQVSGYLVKQLYREGSLVSKGAPLFEIDARPFAALLAQAEAQLAQARAQLGKADLDVRRYEPLARDRAISQEELDNAVQAKAAAAAQVAAAEAGVEQARLNLGFTRIESPIDGIAGLVQGQIGDLVGPSTGALTTVSTVDPIKAYFPVSEQSYLELRRFSRGGSGLPEGDAFELILSDGTTYPMKGRLLAIDRQVDANTGTIRVAALFPNRDALLRPGQFARVRATMGTIAGALLVPRRAVTELQGGYQVVTVDAAGKAHFKAVSLGQTVGDLVVVSAGMSAGDRVIVEGLQKVRDGIMVSALPFAAAQAQAPATAPASARASAPSRASVTATAIATATAAARSSK